MREMVVLPAPEGEERTNNTPRRFRWTLSAMGAIRQSCATGKASDAGSTSVERGERGMAGISRTGWLVAAGLFEAFAAGLFARGRPPLSTCGTGGGWPGHVQANRKSDGQGSRVAVCVVLVGDSAR